MNLTPPPELPGWPALMSEALACAYLDVKSEKTLRKLVNSAGVRPLDLGVDLVRFRRSDLDAMVEKFPFRDAASETAGGAPQIDPVQAALAAIDRQVAQATKKGRKA